MDRRLQVGLAVLGVAVAVAVGILLLGGDDGSDGGTGTDTNSALSNDERPDPAGDGGSGGSGDKDENGDGSGGGRAGGGQGGSGTADGNDPDHSGPPVEQDPPGGGGGGGGNQPQGDPADVAAVTDVLTTYLQAIAAGDGDTACAQLSPSGETTMLNKIAKAAPETEGAPCSQAILLYQGAYGESASDPTFKNIVVEGDTATAIGPLKEPARLSVTDGQWLIDEYGQ